MIPTFPAKLTLLTIVIMSHKDIPENEIKSNVQKSLLDNLPNNLRFYGFENINSSNIETTKDTT